MRIISASYVTADSGTGLVHCAPAHGVDDYNLFRELALLPTSSSSSMQNMICHIDEDGRFIPEIADVVGEEAARELVGKEALNDGGKAVVALLRVMVMKCSLELRGFSTGVPMIGRPRSPFWSRECVIYFESLLRG